MAIDDRVWRRAPIIVVLCGPPCSGKTTISKRLRDELWLMPFPRYSMDDLRLSLAPNSHTAEDRANAYLRMHELAAEALRGGAPGVILDATYQPAQQRHALQVLADRSVAELIIFECKVDPDVAVARFLSRGEAHAGIDLSPQRVWDLAHDFPYSEATPMVDTSKSPIEDIVESVVRKIRSAKGPQQNLESWISRGIPGSPTVTERIPPSDNAVEPKLSPNSRAQARWWLWGGHSVVIFSVSCTAFIVLIFLKLLLERLPSKHWFPWIEAVGLEGKPTEWIPVWIGMAALAGGLGFIVEFFTGSSRIKDAKAVCAAGKAPRLNLREVRVPGSELARRFKRRFGNDDLRDDRENERMPIAEVPLWFLVTPRAQGFDVLVQRAQKSVIDHELLIARSAEFGLDWAGFCRWRTEEHNRERYTRSKEMHVRALGFEDGDPIRLTVCQGDYDAHFCTELSANFGHPGRHGFEMRDILEGPAWQKWDPEKRHIDLKLRDLASAAITYEMLISVQVALTTSDGYLVLQRRSNRVQSAAGGVASSGAGAANWGDFWGWRRRLRRVRIPGRRVPNLSPLSLACSALREIFEEIGWAPQDGDDLSRPFLGAAFSLLRGRDLNFYCHFHTRRTFKSISDASNKADYAWEVAHLIPIPVEAITRDGLIDPTINSILGDARHVRGLIYCLSRSDKFAAIRSECPKNRTQEPSTTVTSTCASPAKSR